MATSTYFRNYDNIYEQNLIDDLVIESIKIYGLDVIYLPRKLNSLDRVMNEDDTSSFGGDFYESYEFEVYVKNVDGFEGEGDFLSKFGLQIRDQVTLSVANRTFERYVTRDKQTLVKPREGDLIYFPLNEKIFEIKFVEDESVFYQMGSLQILDMTCELFEYSGEVFNTGRDAIDTHYSDVEQSANTVTTLESLEDIDESARNLAFEQAGDDVIDFSEIDPFSENIEISDLDL